jgi:predicted kinase
MNKNNGIIVLLNGVSSSGKSTLLSALYEINKSYKAVKVDSWFSSVLIKKIFQFGWDCNTHIDQWFFLHSYSQKEASEKIFSDKFFQELLPYYNAFYLQAEEIASRGYTVIIDSVFPFEPDNKMFRHIFKQYTPLKVLLYCPVSTILARVEQRNQSNKLQEMRTALQSLEQFAKLFKVIESTCGIKHYIDNVCTHSMKQSLEQSIAYIASHIREQKNLYSLEDFKQQFIQQFDLNKSKKIILSPQHTIDFLCMSEHYSPQELALQLDEWLKKLAVQM